MGGKACERASTGLLRASSGPGWHETILDFGEQGSIGLGKDTGQCCSWSDGPLLPDWLGYVIDTSSLSVTPRPEMREL